MKAYPQHYNQAVRDKLGGMDLRDYFAAHALQALVARTGLWTRLEMGKLAYEYADEMMEVRQQEKTNG